MCRIRGARAHDQRREVHVQRQFPAIADTLRLTWHRIPTDDVWKQAHLAMVEGLGKRLWLGCDGCQNTVMIAPRELADRHGLDMRTPLQTLSRALRCTRCGEGRGKPA